MSNFDLENVIEDAITDNSLPADTADTSVSDTVVDTAADASESPVDASLSGEASEVATDDSLAVESPATRQQDPEGPVDPNAPAFGMDKKLGIPSHTNGRENRIPYSRVKKIVEKAEKEALAPIQAKLAEYEAKIPQYEQHLQKVAEFEHVMVNEPQRFMEMLSQIPAYQPFFENLQQLQMQLQAQAQTVQKTQQTVDNDPMPEPDDTENGIYTMEGLKKLLDWQARQVEARTLQQVEGKYAPIRQEWEAQQNLNRLIPQVERQIQEARQWPLFNESEDEIVQFLNQNPAAKLEDAYRVVVFPKLQAQRDKIRQEVLAEIKKAPVASSTPARQARPQPQVASGPQSLEDVIAAQVATIRGR